MRFRKSIGVQIEIEVTLAVLLVVLVLVAQVFRAVMLVALVQVIRALRPVNRYRRLLAVQAQMDVRMRVRNAREKHGERGKGHRRTIREHVGDSNGRRKLRATARTRGPSQPWKGTDAC